MTPRTLFRSLHVLLAGIAIASSVVLAQSDGGHPPAIIFLPVVWVTWLAGHVFLAIVHGLIRRAAPPPVPSRAASTAGGEAAGRWPWPIVVVFAISAIAFFTQFNSLAWSLATSVERGTPGRLVWVGTLVGATSVVFVSILIRRTWARILLGAVWALLCGLIVLRIGTVLAGGHALSPYEALIALLYVGGSGGLAVYFLRSESAATFFARRG